MDQRAPNWKNFLSLSKERSSLQNVLIHPEHCQNGASLTSLSSERKRSSSMTKHVEQRKKPKLSQQSHSIPVNVTKHEQSPKQKRINNARGVDPASVAKPTLCELGIVVPDQVCPSGVAALEYLVTWRHKREEWKFQKVRQVWLLQNAYDQVKVPDHLFETFLEYIENLMGRARDETLKQVRSIMDDKGQQLSLDDNAHVHDSSATKIKHKRAIEMLRVLSY